MTKRVAIIYIAVVVIVVVAVIIYYGAKRFCIIRMIIIWFMLRTFLRHTQANVNFKYCRIFLSVINAVQIKLIALKEAKKTLTQKKKHNANNNFRPLITVLYYGSAWLSMELIKCVRTADIFFYYNIFFHLVCVCFVLLEILKCIERVILLKLRKRKRDGMALLTAYFTFNT